MRNLPKQLEKVHENPWQHGQDEDEDEEHVDEEEDDGEFGFELEGDEPNLPLLRRLITGGVL